MTIRTKNISSFLCYPSPDDINILGSVGYGLQNLISFKNNKAISGFYS